MEQRSLLEELSLPLRIVSVYFKHRPSLFLCRTSGEWRGRNQRHGHWLSPAHICLPAVHVFTPDPSQVTGWVAASLSPSHHPPLLPKRFSFLPTLEEKASTPGSHELLQQCSITLTPPSRLGPSHRRTLKIGNIQR